jgi:hypothetical protein
MVHKTGSDDAIYHFAGLQLPSSVPSTHTKIPIFSLFLNCSIWHCCGSKLPTGKPCSLIVVQQVFVLVGVNPSALFPWLQWRASAIAQSGFKLEGANMMIRYYKAVMQPPYRGVVATMVGMTWARAAIFYGSDVGKEMMMNAGFNATVSQTMPPLIIGTLVQIINMPLVRATITIQDPSSTMNSTTEAMVHIYRTRGIAGLWHGVSAGIMKTVPKYVTAVAVKDYMEDHMPRAEPGDKQANMLRSAVKSVSAGLAGAILTNPLDVLRNE